LGSGARQTSPAVARNLALFNALRELRKTPRSPRRREEWITAAIDLTKAVFVIQFASMRSSPDREDLEQSALLEFHRVADKLAVLTDTLPPDVLFRVLYSVAKYAMFRELARLKKGSMASFTENMSRDERNDEEKEFVEDEEAMRVALSLDDPLPEPPVEAHELPETRHEDHLEKTVFMETILPDALLSALDDANIYALTPWGSVVRFCAIQRLRGRFPSPSLIKAYWHVPDPFLAITYGDHVARHAVLRVPEYLEQRL
jgi:hypothetical protein